MHGQIFYLRRVHLSDQGHVKHRTHPSPHPNHHRDHYSHFWTARWVDSLYNGPFLFKTAYSHEGSGPPSYHKVLWNHPNPFSLFLGLTIVIDRQSDKQRYCVCNNCTCLHVVLLVMHLNNNNNNNNSNTYLVFSVTCCYNTGQEGESLQKVTMQKLDNIFKITSKRCRSAQMKLECGPMPNLMVALPNIGGALCSTPQSLADAHY